MSGASPRVSCMPSWLRWLIVGIVAFTGGGWLSLRLADDVALRPFEVEQVPRGDVARVLSLGHRGLVSDLYWLAVVQYIGEPHADDRGWDKLYALIDLVTDLDPRHGYAYQTGGIVLSAVGRVDQSNRILEKGVSRGPPYWTFPYYLAFNHWFYQGDYPGAARWAEQAARTPGASANISHLALSLAAKSGTPEQAIELLETLRSEVRDPATAKRLDRQLRLAVLERDAQALERAAAEYQRRTGHPIRELSDLIRAGLMARIPDDPFGGSYLWAPDGKVHSTVNSFRFGAPEKPVMKPGLQFDRERSTQGQP